MSERPNAPLPQELKDTAYRMYADHHSIADIAEALDIKPKTVDQWRSRYGWVEKREQAKYAKMQDGRDQAEQAMIDALPKVMQEAVRIALEGAKEETRAVMCRYILATMGYSPNASDSLRQAMETKIAAAVAAVQSGDADPEHAAETFAAQLGDGFFEPYDETSPEGEPPDDVLPDHDQLMREWSDQ